ncbi:type 1 fimbria pilin [Serratia fonticola]|uniref:Type 1 fimbria pilin n=1 Tax=Serratia fonticola TaxID=47917 RepID=A0A542BUK0_SERFO|nr:fimbrial protein [Serratia fonticola]TQI82268.1 type 1 fimbria pilin [Serratia fonticola]TQI95712.1 type 1 fimbria pilin [Serratia fonticola]TVZ70208.1 type 1 fimbria pilin [Serratia fonticola]
MKLNNIIIMAAVAFGASSMAYAKEQGHGKVTFEGAIIDAPCSITPEASDQTVELGQISNVTLKNGGKSTPRNFTIDLENCEISQEADAKNKVSVSFSGTTGAVKNMLGTGLGASIAITDGAGKIIELTKPTSAQELQNGNNSLKFTAYLQGDGASATVTEGKFSTTANFTLAYE